MINRYHRGAIALSTVPEPFAEVLRSVATDLEAFLVENSSRETVLAWLEPYFAIHQFIQICDTFDESYRTIVDPQSQTVTLFCLDPSKRLAQTLKGLRAAVFFSATLSPPSVLHRRFGWLSRLRERFLSLTVPVRSNGSTY